MDEKTLRTLEYDKVLERLASYTAFNASAEKARDLRPTTDMETARARLAETTEARRLLITAPETTIGGARDVRVQVEGASRGVVLTAADLLDVKSTLISARTLERQFEHVEGDYTHLKVIAGALTPPPGLVDAITRTISDRAEILDTASPKLGGIRRDLRIAHERLLNRMQRLLNNQKIAPYLQEALVTQRDGRYVVPLRAEAKGRVQAVVHDVSASGATLFVEPLEVVELNNAWRELQIAERDEEHRVLTELSARVGEHMDMLLAIVEAIAELDLAFARAKYAEALRASEPILREFQSPKDNAHPGLTLQLLRARHPLLDQDSVVPIDLELEPSTFALIITGPNTGGKTVTLKTAGLLALMAQSGLHIPAQSGSEISLFDAIYADIGDEQSIEQSLSTFSGHITNIVHILERADTRSLVVLDELGAGTDPQEGAALARAILTYLVERRIPTLVATHYPELKTYAHTTPGVVNASVEFDLETLRPTYHLTIGLPGRSNALAIARRLGLKDEIVEAARSTIDPAELRAEDLLNEIHRQRDLTRQARDAAETAQREAEQMRAELAERLEQIEDERLDVISKARQEAQNELADLKEEIDSVRRDLARARQPLDALRDAAKQAEDLEEEVAEPVVRRTSEMAPRRAVLLGDHVRLRSLDRDGVVTALGEEEAEVQIGNLRVRVPMHQLEISAAPQQSEVSRAPAVSVTLTAESPGAEISLRGQTVDEALEALDRYLDAAYVAGLPYARVIHGKGTGKVREAVRRELKSHPHVQRFEPGGDKEGGDGVTVVFFKKD